MVTDAEITINDSTEGAANTADVDTESLTINSKTVHRQRIRLAGENATDLAQVKNSMASQLDYGLIVRDVGAMEVRRLSELQFLNSLQSYQNDTSLLSMENLNNLRGSR